MLTVSIEHHIDIRVHGGNARLHGSALPTVLRMDDYLRPCLSSSGVGPVLGAIVHNHDPVYVRERVLDHGSDGVGLVKSGDDRGEHLTPSHELEIARETVHRILWCRTYTQGRNRAGRDLGIASVADQKTRERYALDPAI